MRTKQEIDKEIQALKRLKPVKGPHYRRLSERIALVIEELEIGVDDTTEEWNEMLDSDRDAVTCAKNWKESLSDDRPSTGWGDLVEFQEL